MGRQDAAGHLTRVEDTGTMLMNHSDDTLPAHQQLRRATRDAHARLDSMPAFSVLLSPDVRHDDIVFALRILWQHFSVWEGAMLCGLRGTICEKLLAAHTRAHLLRSDLMGFGYAPEPPEPHNDANPLPFHQALGWFYVHAGSALGGLVIRQSLEKRFGAGLASGLTFFAGNGRDTALIWQDACAVLDQNLVTRAECAAAISGALDAFTALSETASRMSIDNMSNRVTA